MNEPFSTSQQTSEAIRLIRPLLIVFVMLAHFTALDAASVLQSAGKLDVNSWLTVFLKSVLAKGGVPLLSLISGYLAVQSLERHGYFKLLAVKAKRLVWPLIWSNLLFILLVLYPTQAKSPGFRSDLSINPFDLLGWFQATFAYYRIPANAPLYFLKDLYACFLLIPLLLLVARIKYLNIAVIFWMAYKCVYLKTAFIIPVYPIWFFRFDIVFAFYLGILLFHWHKELIFNSRALNVTLITAYAVAASIAGVVYVLYAQPENRTLFLWLDFAVKCFSVLGSVAVMSLLSARSSWLSTFFEGLSPYAYSMFLTHLFSFFFFRKAWPAIFDKPEFFKLSGSLFIVLSIALATVLAVVLHKSWFTIYAAVKHRLTSQKNNASAR